MTEPMSTSESRNSSLALKLVLAAIIIWLLACAYRLSAFHAWVEEQGSFPLYFRARQALGLAPSIDPRLKMFSYDDSTFAQLGRAELSFAEWTSVLVALDAQQPRAIFIDQIFGSVPNHPGFASDAPADARATAQQVLDAAGRLKTPLITAAFIRQNLIKRPEFKLTAAPYQLKNYFDSPQSMIARFPPMIRRDGWRAYGASPTLQAIFRTPGHTLNGGHGRVQAIIALSANTVIPHLALMGPQPLKITQGQLLVDQIEVPLNRKGELIPNFTSIQSYYQNNWRIFNLVSPATMERTVSKVKPDDFVLLIPASFTGHADFTDTPIGPMPGAFVIASILNSRLTGQWLTQDGYTGLIEALVLALAIVLYLPSGTQAILLLVGGNFLLLGTGLAIFSLGSHVISLSSALFAFNAMGLLVIALKSRIAIVLRQALSALSTENANLRAELYEAAAIANVLLPSRLPSWPGLKASVHHQPLNTTSGDWYTFESSSDKRFLHFVLCDITGHGAQAAIIVSTCKSVLSLMDQTERHVFNSADFMVDYAKRLNLTLFQNGLGMHTTTFIGVTFDRQEESFYLVCAAHPRPILMQSQKTAQRIGKQCPLLGFDPGSHYIASKYRLMPGDMLAVFTDGIVMPRQLEKIVKIFRTLSHHRARVMARHIANELTDEQRRHALRHRESDDACLAIFAAKPTFSCLDQEKAA